MNGEGYAPWGTINPISPNVIMNPMASTVDQVIAKSSLAGPPSKYLNPPITATSSSQTSELSINQAWGQYSSPIKIPRYLQGAGIQGSSPVKNPSQSTGSMETGQQPEDLIWNHPFTFEGEPRTPENWPEIYSQYLDDSPSSRHSGTTLHQSPVRNSKKEQETYRKLETMRRHADNFFNRTRVTNNPPSPETEVARFQRIRAETVVQEVRLCNFDDVLMDPRELFNQIGIVQDRDILAELVMGQYDLAKKNNNCSWLYEARRMAVLCLPENWVDTNLCRWNPGKPLISGRRKTNQLQPYSPHQEWRRIGVSWWRGRICRASGQMLLRQANGCASRACPRPLGTC